MCERFEPSSLSKNADPREQDSNPKRSTGVIFGEVLHSGSGVEVPLAVASAEICLFSPSTSATASQTSAVLPSQEKMDDQWDATATATSIAKPLSPPSALLSPLQRRTSSSSCLLPSLLLDDTPPLLPVKTVELHEVSRMEPVKAGAESEGCCSEVPVLTYWTLSEEEEETVVEQDHSSHSTNEEREPTVCEELDSGMTAHTPGTFAFSQFHTLYASQHQQQQQQKGKAKKQPPLWSRRHGKRGRKHTEKSRSRTPSPSRRSPTIHPPSSLSSSLLLSHELKEQQTALDGVTVRVPAIIDPLLSLCNEEEQQVSTPPLPQPVTMARPTCLTNELLSSPVHVAEAPPSSLEIPGAVAPTTTTGTAPPTASASFSSSAVSLALQQPIELLRSEAEAWCPWSEFSACSTTLEGWGLPVSVVQQWATLGVTNLHIWQRACLYEFSEHVAKGLRHCAQTLERWGSRYSSPLSERERGSPESAASSSFSTSLSTTTHSSSASSILLSYPTRNLVYSAPTSGGKALISDLLVLRTLLGVVAPRSTPALPTQAVGSCTPAPSLAHGTPWGHTAPPYEAEQLPPPRRIAIYALPFVALAEERARHLEHVCATLAEVHVVCLAGGAPLLLLEDRLNAQHLIYVCTNEKAHALWRELESGHRLAEVAVVVVDEVHYLSDDTRGYVLELFLTSVLRYAAGDTFTTSTVNFAPPKNGSASAPPSGEVHSGYHSSTYSSRRHALERLLTVHHQQDTRLQVVVTSATIANPQTLATWCGNAFLFLTDHRPVPLQCFSVVQGIVYNGNQQAVRDLTASVKAQEAQHREWQQSARHRESEDGRRAVSSVWLPTTERLWAPHPLALLPRVEEEALALWLAVEGWEQGFQVLLFTPTRKEAELTARRLSSAVAMRRLQSQSSPPSDGVEERDDPTGERKLPELRDSTPAVREVLQFTTHHGRVGFHHAGLGSKDRVQLEQSYRAGGLWALCCTTTLSTGMNLPCRRVLFTAPRIGIAVLDTLTFLQAAGRAGRVGLDPYGEAFVIGKPTERALLRQLAANRLPPLLSNFAPSRRGVARVLLDGMASVTSPSSGNDGIAWGSAAATRRAAGGGDEGEKPSEGQENGMGVCGPAEVHRVLLGTLYAVIEHEKTLPDNEYAYGEALAGIPTSAPTPVTGSSTMASFTAGGGAPFTPALLAATKEALSLLETSRFISYHTNSRSFTLTPLGSATASSLFSPEDALLVLQDLQRSARQFCLADDLHLLYHCTPLQHDVEPDWHTFYHCWGHLLFQGPTAPLITQVVQVEERTLAGFAMAPPARRSKHPIVMRCRRLYGALILSETVREEAPGDVALKFGVYGGAVEVQRLMETAALFASSLARFAHALNWWYLPPLFNIMVVRLRRGVAPDLLPLMEIEGLTPWRARVLFDRGYRTVRSIAGATTSELQAVFAKHSLHGFQLGPGGAVEDTDSADDVGAWCRSNDVQELARQLQQRAKLVLWREAKDLEAILLSGNLPPAASDPAKPSVTSAPDPVAATSPERRQDFFVTPSSSTTPYRKRARETSAIPFVQGKTTWEVTSSTTRGTGSVAAEASASGREGHKIERLAASAAYTPPAALASLLLHGEERLASHSITRSKEEKASRGSGVVVCTVKGDDEMEVKAFEWHLNRLLHSSSFSGGRMGQPELLVSLRVWSDEEDRRLSRPVRSAAAPPQFLTMTIAVHRCSRRDEEVPEHSLSLKPDEGGVIFCVHHCPVRSAAWLPPRSPPRIYLWFTQWLHDNSAAPPGDRTRSRRPYEKVWIGLQQQMRFLVSAGWLRKDSLCAAFQSRTPSPASLRTTSSVSPTAAPNSIHSGSSPPLFLHDPLVALWMLHPEVDTSGVANSRLCATALLPALLHTFPCPEAQRLLLLGSRPPSRESAGGGAVQLYTIAEVQKILSSETSRPTTAELPEHPSEVAAEEKERLSASVKKVMISASGSLRSCTTLAPFYTQRTHQESVGCLAAAMLMDVLLHLIHHEEMYDCYAEQEMWMPLLAAQMELVGIGFNLTLYPPLMQTMQTKIHELTAYAYEVVGRSNWSLTSPRDCAAALYDDLKLPCLHYLGDIDRQAGAPLPRRCKLLKENRSTKASVLVQLSRLYPDNPLPSLLMEFRRLEGWGEKYMEPLQRAAMRNQPQRQQQRHTSSRTTAVSRVHGQIFTTATATGRLSMSEPSLQTIPHPVAFALHGRQVEVNLRRALIPSPVSLSATALLKSANRASTALADPPPSLEHAENRMIFLSADYSHIEARLLAHFSQDPALLEAFPLASSGGSMHTGDGTGSASPRDIFRALAAELFQKASMQDVAPEERRIAKSIWYGTMYGRGKHSVANELYLSVEAAEKFLRQIREKYATTIQCMAIMAQEAAERGFVRTLRGRKRWLPTTTGGAPQRSVATEAGKSHRANGWNAFERVAINTLCQASAADIMKSAMVRIALDPLFQGLWEEGTPPGAPSPADGAQHRPPVARMVLQVHDELLFELRFKDRDRVVEALTRHMDLGEELQLRVPLVINFQWGDSWGDLSPL